MIKHMPFPNDPYRNWSNNISDTAIPVVCWHLVNNTIEIKRWCLRSPELGALEYALTLPLWPVELNWDMKTPQVNFIQTCCKQHALPCLLFFFPRELCSLRRPLTSTPTHWSPAVQHWSLCVFWCTGPECDVVSLPRQKRQAQSPPPGALATHLDTVCNHNWMP